jgi:hypothetical protein
MVSGVIGSIDFIGQDFFLNSVHDGWVIMVIHRIMVQFWCKFKQVFIKFFNDSFIKIKVILKTVSF